MPTKLVSYRCNTCGNISTGENEEDVKAQAIRCESLGAPLSPYSLEQRILIHSISGGTIRAHIRDTKILLLNGVHVRFYYVEYWNDEREILDQEWRSASSLQDAERMEEAKKKVVLV